MDTVGDMIDKLTIANIRLWMLEDERRAYTETDESRSEEDLKEFLRKISRTNRERNSLIDQINSSLAVLVDRAANQDTTLEITSEELLGTGKNKFYRKEDRQ